MRYSKSLAVALLALSLGCNAAVAAHVQPAVAKKASAHGLKARASAQSGHVATFASSRQTSMMHAGRNGRRIVSVVHIAPPRPSFGEIYGLHQAEDALELKSGVALIIDQDTDEILFSKNPFAVLPIASLTKLMTALVVTEAKLPLNETLPSVGV